MVNHIDFFHYRISYEIIFELDLIVMFVTGLVDDYFRSIKPELAKFKDKVINLIVTDQNYVSMNSKIVALINSLSDPLHERLKPKIALVGFSGVGKTTIKKLIKLDEIPLRHFPTIIGDIATIRIGELFFNLFDFAGQDQFKYLWKGLIKGSDAVLLVTDSTPENVENSKFFMELIQKEAPYARSAIIGNKQDLPEKMNIEDIEKTLGLKTYPMIANKPENRDEMISIIAEILDISADSNPIIDSLMKESSLLNLMTKLKNEKFKIKLDAENRCVEVNNTPNTLDSDSEVLLTEIKLRNHISDAEKKLKEELEDFNLKERLLGIIKAKKHVKLKYIERFLKIDSEKIVGIIFDLIGSGKINGEFNEDDTEFSIS